jgi:hypothetical protein
MLGVVEVPLPLPDSAIRESIPLAYWHEPAILTFDRRGFFLHEVRGEIISGNFLSLMIIIIIIISSPLVSITLLASSVTTAGAPFSTR